MNIFINEQYPHGYATAKNHKDAHELAKLLIEKTTAKSVTIVRGEKHWKTGKPAYMTVYFTEAWKVKEVTT